MNTITVTPSWAFEYLAPDTLLIDANVRLDPRLDKDFLASVKEDGVLVPVLAVRTADGQVRVRDGHRRVLAAIQAGHTVPVIITGDEGAGKAADIERIIRQFTVNTHRAGLTAAEQAAVVATLFDLDVPAATVQKRTRLSKEQVEAARKVATSKVATAASARYDLDLGQIAAIAEFEGNEEAVKSLIEAAEEGRGRFAHALQDARDDRAGREAIAAHTAKLAEQGIAVSDGQHYENSIHYWSDADGNRLTAETHKKCPGNVAVLHVGYGREVGESWYCADPKGNGHKRYSGNSGTDQSPEERKRLLAGNKAWRAAETVRRAWLREFLARTKAPDGALLWTLQAFARSDRNLRYAMDAREKGQHIMARELLGIPRAKGSWYDPPEVHTAMTEASPARAQVIALALVLGAYEGATDVHSWRNPSTDTADYLEALTRWGYELSDIERELVASKSEAERAAVIKEDEAAAAEHEQEVPRG
jgi:ParB family chromosome partitioning protein